MGLRSDGNDVSAGVEGGVNVVAGTWCHGQGRMNDARAWQQRGGLGSVLHTNLH